MPREIISATDLTKIRIQDVPETKDANDYKERLVKLIPSEIITAYVTILGLIKGANATGNKTTLLWIVFALLFFLTPLYLYFITNVKKKGQIIFTTIAFAIWVTVVGPPFDTLLGFSASFIGSIILIFYTLLIPFVYKG